MSAVFEHILPEKYQAEHPQSIAHIVADDQEALKVARDLAAQFAVEASQRDSERRLPFVELDAFSASGLWGITIDRQYGGAGVSWVTLTEVIRTIAAADPSLGQLPQNHLGVIDILGLVGSEEQKRFFYAEVLRGKRFGNGFSERGTKNVLDIKTRLVKVGDSYRLDGKKFYSTGALFAHWIPILALDDNQQAVLALLPAATEGLTIIDDWSGFGQRTTASGTIELSAVQVPEQHILRAHHAFDQPTRNGPVSQLIQAAIDAGIAQAALDDTIAFVRERSRPWVDSGVEKAVQDPLTISEIGHLVIELHAAQALLERAARVIDGLGLVADEASVAAASVAVAEAKVLTTEIALRASEKLFELAGTQATLSQHNLDRHWRNARTHTLHDPVRWKYHLVGNYALNGKFPPRHAWN